MLDGVYYYSTGENFEGKLNDKWYCGIPVDGKMVMSDGTVLNGNWLKRYKLTEKEVAVISKQSSPEDKLQKAKYYESEKQKVQMENQQRIYIKPLIIIDLRLLKNMVTNMWQYTGK